MLIIIILVLSSTFSFWLGYLAGTDAGQGSVALPEVSSVANSVAAPTSEVGTPTEASGVVASKNGTKFYLPDCPGVGRISESNKVWFASPTAALAAGYSPAANCKGL
ncbi:MAG: hypothetical protein NUV60_02210 [Patescibacteria group bacterium]|nr:hypothetical protein [Patescibacteria group bacterium]